MFKTETGLDDDDDDDNDGELTRDFRVPAESQIPKQPLLLNVPDPTPTSQAVSLTSTKMESQEGERLGSSTLPTSREDILRFPSVKRVS